MRQHQRGITLVLFSMVLLILLGVAAFAIDLNHQVLNKTRLQNAVDAAALAGALSVDSTGSVFTAETVVLSTLDGISDSAGNSELNFMADHTTVSFSVDRLNFYTATNFVHSIEQDDVYVRVSVSNLALTQYLSGLFGVDKYISASAMAGRSAGMQYSCNLTPIAICGDTTSDSDQAWGYQPAGYEPITDRAPSLVHELKVGDQNNTDMGPGNFQLLDFGQETGNSGAAMVRESLSGAYNGCASIGQLIQTKPGNSTGPVAQGLNVRLNDFSGPIKNDGEVLPDKYVKQPNVLAQSGSEYAGDWYYADYLQELRNCEQGGVCDAQQYTGDGGANERRILRIPIVDCTASTGRTEFEILGFGCFFLLQQVNKSGDAAVFGQFLSNCLINNGSAGLEASDKGFYRIQLYKDPMSGAA
ncbi:TadE/TadG family type IV pilus assembly protein [Vibrio azureus]|uniref:Putative Flp pilus-assembly TadG-like N-terminal domain-containing protein n=1 Tax=Vibrio azureus NBRC 104587 TaxID=1219077 RepID=U3AM75_9VIBR|nr:pilus assembly protein TadG-related protein [Vibrio azureus]GAD74397.1 hypothetical protein VAZ01S_010_00500 [Vibrio azureus NBRC 104587]